MSAFGEIMAGNFENAKPSFEYTARMFVKTINEYVSMSYRNNVGIPLFGINGIVSKPPAPSYELFVPYRTGPRCAMLTSVIPGIATIEEYYKAAARSRAQNGQFWAEFFELIGNTFLKSSALVAPSDGTPIFMNREYFTSTASFIRTTGNKFTEQKFKMEWRRRGEAFQSAIFKAKPQASSVVQDMLSKHVRETAEWTMNFHRFYMGMVSDGQLTGYIFGNMIFD